MSETIRLIHLALIADPLTNFKNIDTSPNNSVKDTCIIHSTINFSMDIKTRYSFCKYHYFKVKIALSPSSSIYLVYFDTNCCIILYDILFFCIQRAYTPI